MIKMDMTSPKLDRQIELLKHFPEVLEKHFRPALISSVKGLEGRIRPTIPVLSGQAQKTFGSKVTGKGLKLTGRVGWYDKNDPWYVNIVEHGAKAHEMNSFVPRLGKRIKTHPGFSKRGFMAAGYSATRPVILAALARANEGVVKDLAIK